MHTPCIGVFYFCESILYTMGGIQDFLKNGLLKIPFLLIKIL